MARPSKLILLTAALWLSAGLCAHAILIERDLFTQGDGLVTFDSATGLEWLDLSVTANMSFNQVDDSAYTTELGFRHASLGDVAALLHGVGVNSTGGWKSAVYLQYEDLMNDPQVGDVLRFFTLFTGQPFGGAYGEIDEHGISGRHSEAGISDQVKGMPYEGLYLYTWADAPWALPQIDPNVPDSQWLVREAPVPEGSNTLWLLLPTFGLLCFTHYGFANGRR